MSAIPQPSFDALKRLPTEDELPYDDGEPLETAWHRPAMNVLIDSLEQHWQGRKDFFVGGNMFMYFGPEGVFNKDFRGPDFFVVLQVDHDKPRKSWIAWQEDAKLPNVIIELSSESTAKVDRVAKWALYRDRLGTGDYFIYEPETARIDGFTRVAGAIKQVSATRGERVFSPQLGLYFGSWEGIFQGHYDTWPRFYDADGNVVPTFGEAAAKEAEEQKKKLAAAKKKLAAEKKKLAAEQLRVSNSEAELTRVKAELEALKKSKSSK